MPALNFQKQFAKKVRIGEKRQTIRAYRKRPFVVGDRLFLYTGMRTKKCEKLGEYKATEILHIYIQENGRIVLEGNLLDAQPFSQIAWDDGFRSHWEMVEWFKKTHGLPFEGQLIRW